MSTPSDTIRTATIQRFSESVKPAIRLDAAFSSESTTVGDSPLIFFSRAAYARAESWSVAMTRPPASGTCRRTSVSRRSAAASTDGIHSPDGSSAVRSACAARSLVSGSPSLRRDLVAGSGAPGQVAGVGQEQHRPDDVVGQGMAVAVGEVGDGPRDAVGARARS